MRSTNYNIYNTYNRHASWWRQRYYPHSQSLFLQASLSLIVRLADAYCMSQQWGRGVLAEEQTYRKSPTANTSQYLKTIHFIYRFVSYGNWISQFFKNVFSFQIISSVDWLVLTMECLTSDTVRQPVQSEAGRPRPNVRPGVVSRPTRSEDIHWRHFFTPSEAQESSSKGTVYRGNICRTTWRAKTKGQLLRRGSI